MIQADLVHRGVSYDLEVDTSRMSAEECARQIVERVAAIADGGFPRPDPAAR